MRKLDAIVERLQRQANMLCCERGEDGGRFVIGHRRSGVVMTVIASFGGGWDHVSVSIRNRCPTWEEMEWVRGVFFEDDEVAMQLSPARSERVNLHPYCLHLWRPQAGAIPAPPLYMV